ncbi:hypothetical protein [Ruminococcus flavefaciens]|uniref:hypothetical protein n=1 Tax=Ruminococcus flavefaciens TaxID=1265 RepID=UPI0013D90D9F|nr:hypothetical protein [Ruminococcus flavefaciens]
MQDFFEIVGTQIPLKEIKSYRIIQREYIYRPLYREINSKIIKIASKKKYEFAEMVPYAAILGNEEYSLAIKKAKAGSIRDSVVKDVAISVLSRVGSKFNTMDFQKQKFKCINIAGRIFECYLKDVPAIIMRNDGKISEVNKEDELYPLLGESIAPAIYIIPALKIEAKDDYIFYGNSVQITDTAVEYERLKREMIEYKNNVDEQMKIETEVNNQKTLPNRFASFTKKILPHKKDND